MDTAPSAFQGRLRKVLTLLFGGVFLLAGSLKLQDPQLFTMQVRSFEMMRDPWNAALALALPWLEILCGLAVITGDLRKGALVLLNGALLVFLAVMGWALAVGKQVDCGCFGTALQLKMPVEFAMDAVLLILGCWLLWTMPRKITA